VCSKCGSENIEAIAITTVVWDKKSQKFVKPRTAPIDPLEQIYCLECLHDTTWEIIPIE